MPQLTRAAAVLAAAALAAPASAPAATALPVRDGPEGRSLLGGTWEFSRSPQGPWTPVRLPHAWNGADDSAESMTGGVGYYRKDFRVPDASRSVRWLVRFESVNHRTRVWLNGRPIGAHTGAYLPFELRLTGVRRRAPNRLVVRVDSRRRPDDLPPAKITSDGVPAGGWFNSSGILRDVYLRAVRGVQLDRVVVQPALPCADARCHARVVVRARLRSVDGAARRVRVDGTFGDRRFSLGTVHVPARGARDVSTAFTVRRPGLWSPAHPRLYDVGLTVRAGTDQLAGWRLKTGVRSIAVRDGRLHFNGEPTSLRGVGYHEDVRGRAAAITRDDRAWLIREAKDLGATMMRTHYPPGADLAELADREGMLLWSEIPVFSVRARYLADPAVRARALRELETNIVVNGSHPSVAIWSIGNELAPEVGPSQGRYIRDAAALAHELDPTRPVALAIFGYPSTPCQPEYAPLDLIGVNEYFGWYPGPGGEVFDRTGLSAHLDRVRDCYPDEAVMVSEFGAEANRDGPVEEKGTWAFQQDFVDYHLNVFATKPWLSGASYWALNEFRVRPGWAGGNPRPQPPLHQKGLVTYDKRRKPAWETAQRWYTGRVPGIPGPSPAPR